jgi:hypothetical protein
MLAAEGRCHDNDCKTHMNGNIDLKVLCLQSLQFALRKRSTLSETVPRRTDGGVLTCRCQMGVSSNVVMKVLLDVAHLNLKLSRLSLSTDRQPISFMSRSISARRFARALSTPACPAAASAYR